VLIKKYLNADSSFTTDIVLEMEGLLGSMFAKQLKSAFDHATNAGA